MKKFKLTKWEWIWLILAILILVGLFISSSMTYHEQKLQPGFLHRHFAFLEDWLVNHPVYYAQKWHSAQLDGKADYAEFIIRKFAHFSTYFLLTFSLYLASKPVYRIKWLWPINTWLIVLGLAALDEYHQYLTGDRTPSVHDVMLDGFGAFCAIVLVVVVQIIIYAYKKNRKNTI